MTPAGLTRPCDDRRRGRLVAAGVLAGLLLVLLAVPPAAAATSTPEAGDSVRIVVRSTAVGSPDTQADLAARLGGDLAGVVSDDTVVVEVPAGSAAGALAAASADPAVAWAERDATYRAAREANDECFTGCAAAPEGQPELRAVNAPEAWSHTVGSPDVVVAVLDTLASGDHPDLHGKVVVGPDFVTDPCANPSARDASHGTAVAGIAGARTDNGVGVASLGWQTTVLSVGVLDGCGTGRAAEIAQGIRHAADAGADVLNLSFTGTSHQVVQDAIVYAQQRGALVVAASGNQASSAPVYPAAYPGVVAVASTDDTGQSLSTFSNRGSWVDIAAPGESILSTSTLPGSYASYDGTSFASPIVAAAAALIWARHPELAADDVAARLRLSARPSHLDALQWGVLDAGRAAGDPPGGYFLATAAGRLVGRGDAAPKDAALPAGLLQPIVGGAAAPGGTWLVARDGGVFSFGGAGFYGSTGGTRLNQPIVGMAATPTGRGYWLVASDGGVFSFGDARFHGSTGAIRLNKPIVGMAATPTGRGYWLVASDGGVFTFGDARFLGSTGGSTTSPVIGLAPAPARDGYWLALASGRVLSFGDAPALGGAEGLGAPVVAFAATVAPD